MSDDEEVALGKETTQVIFIVLIYICKKSNFKDIYGNQCKRI